MYAHCAIVFLRYLMLAYENRIAEDDRTCGELFFLICNELRDITYLQALVILLNVAFTQATADGVLDNGNRSTTTPSPKTQALGKHRGLDYT